MASHKNEFNKNSWGWSWLERWMAAKPWENRLMEKVQSDSSEMTPPPKAYADNIKSDLAKSSEQYSVKIRRNNVTTRISAKPPLIGQTTRSSSSPSSEFRYDKSSASSSFCTSTTPLSANTNMASDRTDDNINVSKPSYMNLTEAAKAKQRNTSHRSMSRAEDEFQFLRKSAVFSDEDSKAVLVLNLLSSTCPDYYANLPLEWTEVRRNLRDREKFFLQLEVITFMCFLYVQQLVVLCM